MPDFQNEHILRGYDPVSHSPVPVQVGTTAIDSTNNEIYAPLQVAGGAGGGGADVQYTDGVAPPVSPVGNALVFDNAGTWNDVGADHPLPVTGTFTPAANQRVSSLANDYATGSIVDLLSLLNITGTALDANTVNTVMGRLTKIRDLLNAALTVSVNNFPATQPISGTITANEGGTWTVQPGNTQNTTPWLVQDNSQAIPYHNVTAASTNFTNTKAVACTLYSLDISNTSAATIFVKLYDKATAPATTDTPKKTIQIPANATVVRTYSKGIQFAAGFGWAATGAVANNDATAIAANCVIDFDLNI